MIETSDETSMQARRPEPEVIMRSLKDFQRATVDRVFQRLYVDEPAARRFLIADEVGLGKTLVAKGVIVKAVDHLWDRVERIDVIYICSNADIARQNINRLNLQADAEVALTSRITLLPVTLPNIRGNKLNFVAFTPGTSFNLRSSQGVSSERVLLYHMLRRHWQLDNRVGPKKVLQGGVRDFERWDRYLRGFDAKSIDRTLLRDFLRALNAEVAASRESERPTLYDRFARLATDIAHRDPAGLPPGLRQQRRTLVGELRALLAKTCIRALEPDVIVLDEFQRFRGLLQASDEMSKLARALFDYRDEAHEHGARVLLLSATPYKMYTRFNETEDDHYRDFMMTMRFLLEGDERAEADFHKCLEAYRNALYRLGHETVGELREAKQAIEARLRQVMVRNERLQAQGSVNAMMREIEPTGMQLDRRDLTAFIGLDRLTRAIGARDHVEYWKSAPYLPNFMERYVLGRSLEHALAEPGGPAKVAAALEGYPEALLNWKDIEAYQRIDPANAKLRCLYDEAEAAGAWRMLWLPPSQPYYAAGGVYQAPEAAGFTKSLVFSAWKMVPRVIATLLSYDVERRMVETLVEDVSYVELRKRRGQLLNFNVRERATAAGEVVQDLNGMPLMTLLYPCLTLALEIDPLRIGAELDAAGERVDAESVLESATRIVEGLLREVIPPDRREEGGSEDQAWYWSALARLDGRAHRETAMTWLAAGAGQARSWPSMLRQADDEGGAFGEHVGLFRAHMGVEGEPGRMPADLASVLARTALASPAVCVLRALIRQWPEAARSGWAPLVPAAAMAAMGFRSLFNLPETITLLRGLQLSEDDEETSYWRRVLNYGLDGNLQAVLDEYVHVLRSALGHISSAAEVAAWPIGEAIQEAAAIRTNSLKLQELDLSAATAKEMRQNHSMRCRYAMSFGLEIEDSGDEGTRDDQVRAAFNSPFRPFVLATTSIGQEGLDFHWYCHRLYHWNLPSNPVDLEQREGRVNRYKGHAVRRNVAERHGPGLLAKVEAQSRDGEGNGGADMASHAELREHADPWCWLFEMARARQERPSTANDLDPYWIYEAGGARVERHVPNLPLSRDRAYLVDLKRSLVAYRLVFGQPRQEDLVEFLTRAKELDRGFLEEVLRECRIDLSAGTGDA